MGRSESSEESNGEEAGCACKRAGEEVRLEEGPVVLGGWHSVGEVEVAVGDVVDTGDQLVERFVHLSSRRIEAREVDRHCWTGDRMG